MQINNYYLSPLGISPAEGKPTVDGPGNAAAPDAEVGNTHTLSPELVHLIQLAGQEPEVRPEVVQQAQDRLAQGTYNSPVSAEQTAKAILTADD
jgi:hypothetical protein